MSLIKPQDKIFVAGHKGMVGSSIVRSLKKNNYKNILTVSKEKLDLRNQTKVDEWFLYNKPNVVILAAAKVGGIGANSSYPVEFLLDNIKIQSNVIESAWKHGSHRLLFLGSSCIYPKYAEQPIKEEALLESALEQTNEWYAIAKITGIKLCEALRLQYGFDAISLMPTNLYGPGDNYHPENSHVVPALIRRFHEAKQNNLGEVVVWGSGTSMREFLFVDDMADASLFLHNLDHVTYFENTQPTLSHINVGTGSDVTIKQLARTIQSVVGFEGDLVFDRTKPDGTPRKLLDVKLLSNLGWDAKIELKTGLTSAYQDYTQNYCLKNY